LNRGSIPFTEEKLFFSSHHPERLGPNQPPLCLQPPRLEVERLPPAGSR